VTYREVQVLDLERWGDCDMCEQEDDTLYVLVDKFGRGHKICYGCLKQLVEWGLIPADLVPTEREVGEREP